MTKEAQKRIEDCATLATAMGWGHSLVTVTTRQYDLDETFETPGWTCPEGKIYPDYKNQLNSVLPDPFTDANVDYAVLVWVRTQDVEVQYNFKVALIGNPAKITSWNYQIGDFAKAAVEALTHDR